jgi:hypothetical protein
MKGLSCRQIAPMEVALQSLQRATLKGRGLDYCLRAWSSFIRLRDGNRCIVCHNRRGLAAHHIVRKSLMDEARLQTGNGITLCPQCHREPHQAFNRKPNLNLPMDAEGGEDIELLWSYFCILIDDARDRSLLHREDFYYFSDQLLMKFKLFQSLDYDLPIPGTRLEQAALIWRQTSRCTMNAILEANGFPPVPRDFIQTGPIAVMYDDR